MFFRIFISRLTYYMNDQIKVLIIENEFAVAMDIQSRLVSMNFEIVGIASTFDEAVSNAASESPDIVLMDIQIDGTKTGIDAARVIWNKLNIPVVYLTGHSETEIMEDAMSTMPLGYVLKPFKDVDLRNQILIAVQQKQSVDNLQHKLKQYESIIETIQPDRARNEILFVKDSKQIFKLPVYDIAYLEAMDNYTLLYTSGNEKYVMNGFLKDIIDKISHNDIIRIHRSYAIAKQHIKQIEENTVTIINRILPVSKSYRDKFYEAINPI